MRHLLVTMAAVSVLAGAAAAQEAGKKARMGPETALVVIDI